MNEFDSIIVSDTWAFAVSHIWSRPSTLHFCLAYRQRSPRFVSSELESLCCDNRLAVFVSTEHRSREHRRHVRTSFFRSAKLSLHSARATTCSTVMRSDQSRPRAQPPVFSCH